MARLFWLSDAQWAVLEPLLPHLGGKPRVDDRRVISGILRQYLEGPCWRAMPAAYGPRKTLFNRFDRWSEKSIWQALLAALVACEDPPDFAMVDSTAVRGHRSAAGAEGAATPGHWPVTRNRMALSTRRSSTRGTPRGFRGHRGAMTLHSKLVRSERLSMSELPSRSLNHNGPLRR